MILESTMDYNTQYVLSKIISRFECNLKQFIKRTGTQKGCKKTTAYSFRDNILNSLKCLIIFY